MERKKLIEISGGIVMLEQRKKVNNNKCRLTEVALNTYIKLLGS